MYHQITIDEWFRDSWSGKTYTEHLPRIEERISEPCWKKPSESKTKMPLFLDLRRGGGLTQELSWETDILLPGEDMTHNGGEFLREEGAYVYSLTSREMRLRGYCLRVNCGEYPSVANPTKLSEILEMEVDPKYNLSPRACLGILNRAERRGKALPPILKMALERQGGGL
jgi:hypothetical protein